MRWMILVLLFLVGCAPVSRFQGDPVRTINEDLDRQESEGSISTTDADQRKLIQLYSDTPEVLSLIGRQEEDRTLPRLRTSVPPAYPPDAFVKGIKATVRLALVVDENGQPTYVRALDATDGRFVTPAIEAVSQWTFYPGTIDGRSDRFLMILPLELAPDP
jgi:TonB family protein